MARYIDIDKMTEWTEVERESCSRENCISADLDCNECYYNHGGAEDVAPVIHAEWVGIDDDPMKFRCSKCSEMYWGIRRNFCPNCGAKMDKE